VKAYYRILLFSSSSFDDDDDKRRAYNNKALYSFLVVLFPKERDTFSLFVALLWVKLYLGFFTNPKQNGALSFFLFWKNRGLLDTLIHYYTIERVVVTR